MKTKIIKSLSLLMSIGIFTIYSCNKEEIIKNNVSSNDITTKSGKDTGLEKKESSELIRLINSDMTDIDVGRNLIDASPFDENVSRALIKRNNMNQDILEYVLVTNGKASNQLITFMIYNNVPEHTVEKILMMSSIDRGLRPIIEKELPNINIDNLNAIGKDRNPSVSIDLKQIIFSAEKFKYMDEDGTQLIFNDAVSIPFGKGLTGDDIALLRPDCDTKANKQGWICGDLESRGGQTNSDGTYTITVVCKASPQKCVQVYGLDFSNLSSL